MIVRAYFVRYVDPVKGITVPDLMKALEMRNKQVYGGLRQRGEGEYYEHSGKFWFLSADAPPWWNETKGFAALEAHLGHGKLAAPDRQAKPVREEVEDWSGLLVEVAYLKALEHELKALDVDHPVNPSRVDRALLRHKVVTTSEERLYIGRRLRDMGYAVITTGVGYPVYLSEKYFGSDQADIEEALLAMSAPAPETDLVTTPHNGEATYELDRRVSEIGTPSGAMAFTHRTDFGNWIRVEVNPALWTTEEKLKLAGFLLSIPVS